MAELFPFLTPSQMILAFMVGLLAGTVKGLVGFAMPMVLVSGLNLFLPTDISLAGLILPTLVTNGIQALRQGLAAAWSSVKRFRLFLGIGAIFLFSSAQLVRILPGDVMLLMIGIPITLFAASQLLGREVRLQSPNARTEAIVAAVAGFIGGFSGVWGPPTVAYLTALNTEKSEQMRVQGVIYGMGAVALVAAHLTSGVLRPETLPFSAVMVVPAVTGLMIGQALHDRIDQRVFRKATLAVLTVAGCSLILRGLSG
ncbi:sulfite exporter TauE/SafE family protein [Marinibacterium profundimaris]|uniref:Probable membrane transporter protein n=1 Tax=Marinibacterium profundimaris TaxID=1679460 RepID=A0A225NMH0_9RHOB|nr:sulfite exporter TauE/SafE family protein [Marinibacterium profundimaris]OWU71728.1 membrane protein [Marinibacterium profundimaris]